METNNITPQEENQPITPEVTISPENESQTPKKKNFLKIILGVVTLVVLAIVLGILYFVFGNHTEKIEIKSEETNFVNKQYYENSKFGYKFKIPEGYEISEISKIADVGIRINIESGDKYKLNEIENVEQYRNQNPELFEEYTNDINNLSASWKLSETESLILIRSDSEKNRELSELIFSADDVILVSIDDDYLESENKVSEKGDKKISTRNMELNSRKVTLIEQNISGPTISNIEVEFVSDVVMYNGNTPESINFRILGDEISQEDIFKIIESIKQF
ncbi:MAG: flagellar basal body-associated protein FliL [Candidatus Paceibacteria bacterium]|jgi:flagellar basal body-associated protein FliL